MDITHHAIDRRAASCVTLDELTNPGTKENQTYCSKLVAVHRYHQPVTFPSEQQPPPWYGPPQQAYHPPQPAPHMGSAPGSPLVIDVRRANTRKLVIAWVLLTLIVLSVFICGVAEVVNGRTRDGLIALAIGGALLTLGLVGMLVRKRAFVPRALVIEQAGIRWEDPKGQAGAVRWQELAAVGLTRHERPSTGPPTLGELVVDGSLGKPVLVHLELYPADPSFRQQRPELAYLWKKDRLRLQLGFNAHQLPQLDAALRYFQPGRYLGIQQTQAVRRFR
jgi:hypothetical protein